MMNRHLHIKLYAIIIIFCSSYLTHCLRWEFSCRIVEITFLPFPLILAGVTLMRVKTKTWQTSITTHTHIHIVDTLIRRFLYRAYVIPSNSLNIAHTDPLLSQEVQVAAHFNFLSDLYLSSSGIPHNISSAGLFLNEAVYESRVRLWQCALFGDRGIEWPQDSTPQRARFKTCCLHPSNAHPGEEQGANVGPSLLWQPPRTQKNTPAPGSSTCVSPRCL